MASASELPNFYEILGISEWASKAKVKEAHHARLVELRVAGMNPKNPTEAEKAQLEALEIAQQVLTNDSKRREYDFRRLGEVEDAGEAVAALLTPNRFPTRDEVYREGLNHLRHGRHVEAAVCFRKTMKLEKNNPYLLKLTAKAYRGAGQTRLAIQAIQQVIELDPEDWDGYLTMGSLQEQQKNLLAAQFFYRRAFRLNPDHPLVAAQYERGSLIVEKFAIRVKTALRNFAPNDEVKSFRLEDGLITRRMLARLAVAARAKLTPQPSRYTFRYTGRV